MMMRTFFWWLPLGVWMAVIGVVAAQEHGHGHAAGGLDLASGRTEWVVDGKPLEASLTEVGETQITLIAVDGKRRMVKREDLATPDRDKVDHWWMQNAAPKGFGEPDQVIRVRTLLGQMRYDREEITVAPGAKVQLVLQNVDDMHHNFLLCAEDSAQGMDVAKAAWELAGEGFAKEWIPDHPKVLFASRMVNPHSTVHGYFTAPQKSGTYPYVCTLPGHAAFMKGVLKVQSTPTDFSELTYLVYEGDFDRLPDFEKLTPVATDHVASGRIDLSVAQRRERFALVFDGFLHVPQAGTYQFSLASDDGSRLRLNGETVVDNDGVHGMKMVRQKTTLTEGRHRIQLAYFEKSGGEELYLGWSGPGFDERPLSVEPERRRGQPQVGIPIGPRDGEARLYRNFIEGAGNRAIGVGYPGGINVAFDADQMRLALIWLGSFMDAARHWIGRGPGHQPPAGYGVMGGPPGAPFARLDSLEATWPAPEERSPGYQFRGYRLVGEQRLPVFAYEWNGLRITDALTPRGEVVENNVSLHRRLTMETESASEPGKVFFRAALGNDIKAVEGGRYLIDASLMMKLSAAGGSEATLRQSQGQWELLLPLFFEGGRAEIEQEFTYLFGNP